jgi:hypothetical protein
MGARGRRSTTAVAAVAVVIGGLSLAGVLAATTDTARTGEARYSTGQFDGLETADVQLAQASGSSLEECGPWEEDLSTPFLTFADSGTLEALEVPVCLRNNSPNAILLSLAVQDLVDDELDCTGTEGDDGFDPTCGPDLEDPDTSRGELSDVLVAGIRVCPAPGVEAGPPFQLGTLAGLAETEAEIGVLEVGESFVMCLSVGAATASDSDRRRSQSDEVRWRFAFVAEAGDGTVIVGEPTS